MVRKSMAFHEALVLAKEQFDHAREKEPFLMKGLAVGLQQGRGISWTRKVKYQKRLYELRILDVDKGGELKVREVFLQFLCPVPSLALQLQQKIQIKRAPSSGVFSKFEEDLPEVLNPATYR